MNMMNMHIDDLERQLYLNYPAGHALFKRLEEEGFEEQVEKVEEAEDERDRYKGKAETFERMLDIVMRSLKGCDSSLTSEQVQSVGNTIRDYLDDVPENLHDWARFERDLDEVIDNPEGE